MTCSVCQTIGHNRKEHYCRCGHCGKMLFFHALRLRDQNEERSSPTGFRFLCEKDFKEGVRASTT